jgi:hypothetical protein
MSSMLDLLSPEFRPFVGVFVLTVLFVSVASLIHKYRLWQADRMAKAQRLLSGAQRLEKALQAMNGIVLPQEMGDLCRNELLFRYRGIKVLFPNFDGIEKRIAETEAKQAGRGGGWDAPQLETEAEVKRHTAAMTEFVEFLSTGPFYSDLSPEAGKTMRERLRTLRAETRFEYFEKSTLAAAQAGDWNKAQNDMLRLMGFLRQKAPPNEKGKELFQKATDLYRHYNHRQMPGEEAGEGGKDSEVM